MDELNGTWAKVESFWKSNRRLAWGLGLVWSCIAIWALWNRPSPGIAIGLLAAGAGLMSLRPPEMHILERIGWIGILVILVTAEILAIKKSDHENITKNQEILDGMTGGDSYLCLLPYPDNSKPDSDQFIVQAFNNGKNTLWDVRVEWQENEPTDPSDFAKNRQAQTIIVGSVSNTYGSSLEGAQLHPPRDKRTIYTFHVFSRNLPTIEQMIMRFDKGSNQWEYSYQISRLLASPRIGGEVIAHQENLHFLKPLVVPIGDPSKQP